MWIYGINTVSSVINKRPKAVKEILIVKPKEHLKDKSDQNPKIQDLMSLANKKSIKISSVMINDLNKKTGVKDAANHQRVLAYIEPKPQVSVRDLLANNDQDITFIILDGITDPNNLGAIIRTAVAFGVKAIILPKDRSAQIRDDVYKTSGGSIEDIDICSEVNLVRVVEELKKEGFWIYGFEEDAEKNTNDVNLKGKICCVLGGEDTGIRKLLSERCDLLLKIPISKPVQSLNVSVSAGIILYEVQRQKGFKF
jgi:23S rRNA (guanosine2251-2'-O)-methyltransferase